MDIEELSEIHDLILAGIKDISGRKIISNLRKEAIKSLSETKIIKLAFDTRRINQEIDYIPRRGLQNYHRSEAFISEALSQKLNNFVKLKLALDELKEKFEAQPEWQDSYARVLLNSINRAIRFDQKDGDYSETQPGVGSLDYLEELLHVRYRLDMNMIKSMSGDDLKRVLLEKDELLMKKDSVLPAINSVEISKRDVATQGYDSLLDKLFGGVKATKENKNVERTVTITIRDSFVE